MTSYWMAGPRDCLPAEGRARGNCDVTEPGAVDSLRADLEAILP